MSTPKPIADNVVLRVMTFAHPNGLDILLTAISSPSLIVPAEVYNFDESSTPLEQSEERLSELAKGLRYATRQVRDLPMQQASRYQTWLANADQLTKHSSQGSLKVQFLTLEELDRRDEIQQKYLIGRGEAACIVLAKRHGLQAVFLSSDAKACKVAQALGVNYTTILEILEEWVTIIKPSLKHFDELLAGMKSAKFAIKEVELMGLRNKLYQDS
jgi:predicted nucleic acid-binding protein